MSSRNDSFVLTLVQNDLLSFVQLVFSLLYPAAEFVNSRHLALLTAWLEKCERGECKRLIICLPPRSLKSLITSVAFVAWVLGRNPHREIVCASYAQDLADKHARDTRSVMMSNLYKSIFPTRISPKRTAVSDFNTTANGVRIATSVGGVLTGRGGDMIIVDDPIKPADAQSETLRKAANDWYDNTLLSRPNNKKDGVIIVIMQRLHEDDLAGHLVEKGGWDVLKLPAIAEENEFLSVPTPFGSVTFLRKEGDVLDPRREPLEVLQQLRADMGQYAFSAQYQQNPQPVGGAIIKNAWLRYYKPAEEPQHFAWKIQSYDTASKSGELNDYTACTTWGVLNNHYYLLNVMRRRLEYPELRRIAKEHYHRYRPRTVLIEDKGSGIQLLQDLRADGIPVTPYCPPSGHDKLMRLSNQSAQFESGRVLLPDGAPWVGDYVRELTTFPSTKYDDQVDSTTQALDYLVKQSRSYCTIQELRI